MAKRKVSTEGSQEKKIKGSIDFEKDFVTEEKEVASDYLRFARGSPSQFHVVAQAIDMLKKGGFQEISEKSDEDFASLKPNGKYFFTRNQSSVVAFAVGGKYQKGNGFVIQAAHTDSPVLKVKPVSKTTAHDYEQVDIETYGGGLWYSWFDRDLSLAGRVIVERDGKFESHLVDLERPVLRIPSLAIHLNRDIYTEGFKPNNQTHLLPILATSVKSQLFAKKEDDKSDKKDEAHHNLLLALLADKLGVKKDQIRDFELCVYDTQPPAFGGALNEFIYARGLDNQCMSYVCTRALIDSVNDTNFKDESMVRMVVLFDNEEIGSQSFYGADSSFLPEVLGRIHSDSKTLPSAIRKSFLVSADMAHAVHPNYADKHEQNHRPKIHQGLVIKHNSSQRYATTSVTSFLLGEVAKRHGLPIQRFSARNDMPCGSTIGPISAAKVGIRTVDVGIPQLSMHSIRELCGTRDLHTSYNLLKHFFVDFHSLDTSLTADSEK